MTTTTESSAKLVSFMELNPTIKGLTSEETFEKYKAFMEPILKDISSYKDIDSSSFWKQILNDYDEEKVLSWINLIEYEKVKEELKNDEKRPSGVLSSFINYKQPLKIEDMSLFDDLDRDFPNFIEVTQYYRGMQLLNDSRSLKDYKPSKPILLLGNAGIGKTYYAKRLAKIFNTDFQFLDANSITATWVLSGGSRGWSSSSVGWVFKLMAKSKTISPIFLIDEIDKITLGKNYDPFSTFHQMFEKENAKEFYDEFMEINFDASNIIYLLTANDIDHIAESLLSRMSVFKVRNPTPEEMKTIIPNIYKECLSGSSLFTTGLNDLEINKLTTFTPREVEQIISSNMFQQASEYSKLNKDNQEVIANKELMIKTFLPHKKGNIGFK